MILNDKSPAEVYFMAGRACETLNARRKSVARAHADRIRKLALLMRQLSTADEDGGQKLAGVDGVSIAPDVQRLVVNPTEGL